jgi:hypothetical protein
MSRTVTWVSTDMCNQRDAANSLSLHAVVGMTMTYQAVGVWHHTDNTTKAQPLV